MKLTAQEHHILRLIEQSQTDVDGWADCSSDIFLIAVASIPVDLVERAPNGALSYKVRLTAEAKIVLKWM